MMWNSTSPKQLLANLRIGGWVVGESDLWPKRIWLHKTMLMQQLKELPANHICLWKIAGDPDQTGQYANDRRTIVLYLGK